jgi:hypothetical protein
MSGYSFSLPLFFLAIPAAVPSAVMVNPPYFRIGGFDDHPEDMHTGRHAFSTLDIRRVIWFMMQGVKYCGGGKVCCWSCS